MKVIGVRGRAFIAIVDTKRFTKVCPGELVVAIAKRHHLVDMFLVAKAKAEFFVGIAFAFDGIVLQGDLL